MDMTSHFRQTLLLDDPYTCGLVYTTNNASECSSSISEVLQILELLYLVVDHHDKMRSLIPMLPNQSTKAWKRNREKKKEEGKEKNNQ